MVGKESKTRKKKNKSNKKRNKGDIDNNYNSSMDGQ